MDTGHQMGSIKYYSISGQLEHFRFHNFCAVEKQGKAIKILQVQTVYYGYTFKRWT